MDSIDYGSETEGGATPLSSLGRKVAMVQAVYFLITGVWPLLSIRSFQKLTGPKTDLWLVETVGGLVGAIGGVLLAAGLRRRVTPELKLLGIGSAAALAAVEGFYALRGRIPPVYLADAVAEVALCAAWATAKPRTQCEHTGTVDLPTPVPRQVS